MTLRQKLDLHISQVRHDVTKPQIIVVTEKAWINAKYLCTDEDKDFTFLKGVVWYKGYKLIKSKL